MRLKLVLPTVVLFSFSLVACAGTPATVPTSAPAATLAPPAAMTMTQSLAATPALTPTEIVTVSMNNFTFIFTPTQITAGVVKFVVHNDSANLIHELFLVKTDLPVNKLPVSADGSSIDQVSTQLTKLGSVEDVDPGQGGEMTVQLDPGHYVYFCNTTGHYKLGMAGEVTVPAAGAAAFMSTSAMSGSLGMTSTVATAPTEVVTVSMTNYAFQFTPTTIKAGLVKFVVKNDSTDQMHELFLVKTDLPVDKLPLGPDGVSINEDSTQLTKLGSVEDVDVGKGGEMTVKLDPGRYVYFCNKQGHYKLGMVGEMTVVP